MHIVTLHFLTDSLFQLILKGLVNCVEWVAVSLCITIVKDVEITVPKIIKQGAVSTQRRC